MCRYCLMLSYESLSNTTIQFSLFVSSFGCIFDLQVSSTCCFDCFETANHFAKQLAQLIQSFEKWISPVTALVNMQNWTEPSRWWKIIWIAPWPAWFSHREWVYSHAQFWQLYKTNCTMIAMPYIWLHDIQQPLCIVPTFELITKFTSVIVHMYEVYIMLMSALVSLRGQNIVKKILKLPALALRAQTNSYTKTLALWCQMN